MAQPVFESDDFKGSHKATLMRTATKLPNQPGSGAGEVNANAAVVGMGAMMAQLPVADLKNVGPWIARCQQRPAMGRAMAG